MLVLCPIFVSYHVRTPIGLEILAIIFLEPDRKRFENHWLDIRSYTACAGVNGWVLGECYICISECGYLLYVIEV